jgi:hypothetical protein
MLSMEAEERSGYDRERIRRVHVRRGELSGATIGNHFRILLLADFVFRSISQSDTSASSSSSVVKPPSPPPPPQPCALLQAIIGIYDPQTDDELAHFPTTCGEYLELLFTHRELFAASPQAHTGCPAGFTRLARALELRAWRADRDCDAEAVAAFRHESWQVSAWLGSGGMWWGGSPTSS